MAEIKTTNAVNTIEIVQSGKTGGIGPTGPAGAISASSSLVITGSLFTSGSGGHITASGNISASGYIIAQHITASGNIEAGSYVSASEFRTTGHITASGNISASGTIYADNFQSAGGDAAGISFSDDLNLTGNLTASGNISASGYISASSIYADTIYTSGSTLYVGSQKFTQTHLEDLKEGRSIRDTADLTAKTYTLADGREISRKYEQRFNRWAPNITFTGEDVDVEYSETDSVPQSYVDLTDRQYTAVIQQGLTKYVQTTADIALSSSATAASTINVKSPNISLTSGRTDNQALVSITGSLSISGSNTFTNWGNFKNRMHQDRHYFTVTTNPWATGGWKDNLGHSVTTPALTGSAPHLHVQLSGSGQVGVGTLAPEHTLHVSASSNNFNALQVEGASQFNGIGGGMTFANATAISADVVVPSNYNAVLWVSTHNPSITVNAGTNYTINTGADVRIVDMSII